MGKAFGLSLPLACALLACALLLWSGAARAQTELNLSATGQEQVAPDEMVASLTVQGASASAAVAQAQVNQGMQKALGLAKGVAGVDATTGNYSVAQVSPASGTGPVTFQASQELQLTMPAPGGVPPGAFTALLGELQQNGLLLNDLEGDLSRAGRDAAVQAAITDALQQMQAQAATIATDLHEQVGVIKSLSVNNVQPPRFPGPQGGLVMMAAAAPPPQAAPGKVSVEADVGATIELTP
jgi:uncharacterized protein YggE